MSHLRDIENMKIFIASPLGFAESSRAFMTVLADKLRELGFEPVNPWDASADLEEELHQADLITERDARQQTLNLISMRIAERNASLLKSCDAVLAVLDGCDVDSGTASEIGYVFGLGGKVINGYRGDFRQSGENDGVQVNLQVQYWIERSGGLIVSSLGDIGMLKFGKKD